MLRSVQTRLRLLARCTAGSVRRTTLQCGPPLSSLHQQGAVQPGQLRLIPVLPEPVCHRQPFRDRVATPAARAVRMFRPAPAQKIGPWHLRSRGPCGDEPLMHLGQPCVGLVLCRHRPPVHHLRLRQELGEAVRLAEREAAVACVRTIATSRQYCWSIAAKQRAAP